MHKRLIVLLGIFLGSYAPASAQTQAPLLILAPEHLAPPTKTLPTVLPRSLTASFQIDQDPGKSPAHFSRLFAAPNARDRSTLLPPRMEQVKTLFFTQSSLPLLQFCSGRLQLDAFQDVLHLQNVQLGPVIYGGQPDFPRLRQSYFVGPRSVHLSGVSLTFHFGRDAQTERPPQALRFLYGIVDNFMN